jgi:peptidoglycan-associated lipoprotein
MMKTVAIPAVILTLVLAGCAKQPSTTQASAPAPGGATGTGLAGSGGAGSTPSTAADGRSAASSSATAGGSGSTGTRPAVKDFLAVADLADIHFDYDRADIREPDAKILDANAGWLKTHADHLVLIEGHCDERGTNEYNTALGDRRAKATMNYLVSRGVPVSRITVISYGEERPTCAQRGADCWAKNRRAHFLVRPR